MTSKRTTANSFVPVKVDRVNNIEVDPVEHLVESNPAAHGSTNQPPDYPAPDITPVDDIEYNSFNRGCENAASWFRRCLKGIEDSHGSWKQSCEIAAEKHSCCSELRMHISTTQDDLALLEDRISMYKKKLSLSEKELKEALKEKKARRATASIFLAKIVEHKQKHKKRIGKLEAKIVSS